MSDWKKEPAIDGGGPACLCCGTPTDLVREFRDLRITPIMAIVYANKNKQWAQAQEQSLIKLLGANIDNQLTNPWFGDDGK